MALNPVRLDEIWLDQDKQSLLRRVQRGFQPLSVTGDGTGAEGYVLEVNKGEVTFIEGDSGNFVVLKVYNGPLDVSDDFTFAATGIGITGHFGIGPERSTYFLDTVDSNSQLEFTASKAGIDPLVLVIRVTLITSPHYRGAFDFLSFPTDANVDDTVVIYSSTASECGIYKYTGSSWVKQTAPTVEMLSASWPDISRATVEEAKGGFSGGPYNTVADYIGTSTNLFEMLAVNTAFINKLVTENAFVTNLFAQEIEIAQGGKLRYYDGVGVSRRAVELSRGSVAWLNHPEGGSVEEVARIKRLGSSGAVIIDGEFMAPSGSIYSSESLLRPVAVGNPAIIWYKGNLRVLYNESYPGIVRIYEIIDSGSGFGMPSIVASGFSGYSPTQSEYFIDADGDLHFSYRVNTLYNGKKLVDGAWESDNYPRAMLYDPKYSVINSVLYSIGGDPNNANKLSIMAFDTGSLSWSSASEIIGGSFYGYDIFSTDDATIIVIYSDQTTSQIYETSMVDWIWTEPVELTGLIGDRLDVSKNADGSVRLVYTNLDLFEVIKANDEWGTPKVVSTVLLSSAEIATSDDGEIYVLYIRDPDRGGDSYLCMIRKEMYSPLATEAQIAASGRFTEIVNCGSISGNIAMSAISAGAVVTRRYYGRNNTGVHYDILLPAGGTYRVTNVYGARVSADGGHILQSSTLIALGYTTVNRATEPGGAAVASIQSGSTGYFAITVTVERVS